jgi:hypothetical protein
MRITDYAFVEVGEREISELPPSKLGGILRFIEHA